MDITTNKRNCTGEDLNKAKKRKPQDRNWISSDSSSKHKDQLRDAHGVMLIVVGNGYGDTSSNPRRRWLHSTSHLYPWEQYESNYSPSSYG